MCVPVLNRVGVCVFVCVCVHLFSSAAAPSFLFMICCFMRSSSDGGRSFFCSRGGVRRSSTILQHKHVTEPRDMRVRSRFQTASLH